MAFEDIDIYPGPGINLLLGTNGSGKSSIIAAIGLCLGVQPSQVIRQAKYKHFIRNGTKGATIKLTLQDAPLLKIYCYISDNNATWKMKQNKYSWESIDKKDLDALMRGLGIHVNNLCMYLPQERVKEFACLSSEELLNTTLEIIDSTLNTELNEMKINKRKIDNNKEDIDKINKQIKKNQDIMDQYKADMDRIGQLAQHQKMLKLYSYRKKEVKYREHKREYHECRHKIKEFIPICRELEEKQEVSARKLEDLKIRYEAAASEQQLAVSEIRTIQRKILQFSDFLKELNNKIFRETDKLRKCNEESVHARNKITELEEKIKRTKVLSDEDRRELERTRDELREKSRQIQIDIREEESQKMAIREKESRINQKMAQLNRQVASAHSRKNVMLDKIKDFGRTDVTKMYDYLKNYPNVFNGEVVGPICIDITLKDQVFAKYFESALDRATHLCFLSETIEDMKELNTYCKINRMDRISILRRKEKKDRECRLDVKALGFDGFLIDFVEAPPIIMNFLKQFSALDFVPIALNPIDYDLDQLDKILFQNGIRRYYIDGVCYNMRKSRYCDSIVLDTFTVRPAFLYQNSSSDNNDLDKLKKKMKKYEGKLRVLSEQKRELQNRRRELPSKELGRITTALKEDAQNRAELSHCNDMLERLRNNLREDIDRPLQAKQKREELLRKKAAELPRYADSIRMLAKEIERYDAKRFALKKAEDDQSKVHHELLSITESLEAVKKQYKEYADRINYLKPIIQKMQQKRQDYTIEEEDEEIYNALPKDLTLLQQKLTEYEHRIHAITNIKPEAKERYLKAKESFEKDSARLEQLTDEVKELDGGLKKDLTKWQQKVQQKVRVLSDAFTKLMEDCGYNGFVMFNKTPTEDGFDLNKFRLDLNVSFKKGAETSILVSTRQSGGEKSVATLMYLLALQSCNSFPFRIIDEINQGMDEQNEVVTFTRAMECAVEQHQATQYFLVSPKLHQNLKMPESTTVLIVMSGPTIDQISRPVMVHEYSKGFTQSETPAVTQARPPKTAEVAMAQQGGEQAEEEEEDSQFA